jgi:tetratricopeptide (TPR) repeat protein
MRLLRRPLAALGFVGAFVGALVSAPALAQQAVDYPPGCDESKVSRGDHERAHTVFLSGKQFLEESNYDKAISYFMDAYSIDCSVHAMLPIIATAYERKGDKAEAIRALGEYLKRAPGAADHEVIEHRIRNLRDQLTRDQPASGPSANPPIPPPATLVPGPTPTAPAPATEPAPTEPAQPQFAGPASALGPEPESRGPGAGPWLVGGLGGAAVAAGVIMFVIGAGEVSDATKDCPGHTCGTDAEKEAASKKQSDGYTLENSGAAVGIVGAAGVIAGVVWGVVGAPHAKDNARVTPVISPGYCGIAISDNF